MAWAAEREVIPVSRWGRWASWADLSWWVNGGFTSPHCCPWRMLSWQQKVPGVAQTAPKSSCSSLPLLTHRLWTVQENSCPSRPRLGLWGVRFDLPSLPSLSPRRAVEGVCHSEVNKVPGMLSYPETAPELIQSMSPNPPSGWSYFSLFGHKLKHRKFRLNMRKNFFPLRVTDTGTGCPGRLWSLLHWRYSRPA